MMKYILIDKNGGQVVSRDVSVASTFWQRCIGLMFRPSIEPDEALLFYQATSIHTFFMNFPIDILFLDKNMQIIRVCEALAPWRTVFCFGAYLTVELPAHRAAELSVSLGDVLALVPPDGRSKD